MAHVRAVSLNGQRHEGIFARRRPAVVRLGRVRVQARALHVLGGAGGAGDDGNWAVTRVREASLSPGPAGDVTSGEGVRFGRAGLVLLTVLCRGGDLVGVRSVFQVSVFALVVAVLVAVAVICSERNWGIRGVIFIAFIEEGKLHNSQSVLFSADVELPH